MGRRRKSDLTWGERRDPCRRSARSRLARCGNHRAEELVWISQPIGAARLGAVAKVGGAERLGVGTGPRCTVPRS
ncbi:hypothetical protein ACFPN7_20865 [Amycolatopsis halotolerans]|uniref:hypothetical protein n=1 Tax=Amycolatopsis halotolerans TaxID=330083 RepID=UPI003623DB9E